MKIIPSPPTDNLYKFAAVFGLWLSVILIAFMAFCSYLFYASDQEAHAKQYNNFAERRTAEIARRMKAIDEARFSEDRATDTPAKMTVQQERLFWPGILGSFRKSIDENERLIQRNSSGLYDELNAALGIDRLLFTLCSLAMMCLVLGFWGWGRYVQKPSDKLAQTDVKIREIELKLKEAELRQKEIEVKLKAAELRRIDREEAEVAPVRPEATPGSPSPLPEAA